jgi:hypothetical protein
MGFTVCRDRAGTLSAVIDPHKRSPLGEWNLAVNVVDVLDAWYAGLSDESRLDEAVLAVADQASVGFIPGHSSPCAATSWGIVSNFISKP